MCTTANRSTSATLTRHPVASTANCDRPRNGALCWRLPRPEDLLRPQREGTLRPPEHSPNTARCGQKGGTDATPVLDQPGSVRVCSDVDLIGVCDTCSKTECAREQ